MQLALGILLLVSFLVFIVYAAKGGNLMMGLFVMAVLWCAIGAIGGVVTWEDINTTVFNQGPLDFGSTAVNIIFGSWFGRILVETGIAGTIIRKAVELGGDKPGLTTSLLCIVTTAIFTTAYGVGAVIAIGVIVFPILLSLGISKPLAAAAYTMSVGAGLYFNSSLLNQAAGVMVVNDEQYTFGPEWYRFAAVALAIHLLGVILMVLIGTRKGAKSHAWAASAGSMTTEKNVNLLACLTPIIPVTISIAFGVQSIPSIILAVIWALAWTGYYKSWNGIGEVVQKTFHDGVSDVGLVLAFLMFLQMFNKSAGLVNELLKPIVAPIIPTNVFVLFLAFGLLSFLSLFRGPLTIWGAGVATFAIVAGTGILPLAVLYPLFYIQSTTVTTNCCPTQSWNMWAIGYTKISTRDYMKQTLVYALPTALILEIVAYFMFV